MSEIILELFSEEIPALMQTDAEKKLSHLLTDRLEKHQIEFGNLDTYSGPRRLIAHLTNVALKAKTRIEERKGPRINAAEQAIHGFLRSVDLKKIHECDVLEDKKGQYYAFKREIKGRPTEEILTELIPEILAVFPWSKSMRWGKNSFRWVRPLHRILCVFNEKPIIFKIEGLKIQSNNLTEGHRVLGRGPFKIRNFKEYQQTLEKKGFVLISQEKRKQIIVQTAKEKCNQAGIDIKPDEKLLSEITGLVEWPIVIIGKFSEKFLSLPHEILIASMRYHQKYFASFVKNTQTLAPSFIFVANLLAEDGGKEILAGNERVLKARLEDARYFWEQDTHQKSELRFKHLESLVFYHKLGSMSDKTDRMIRLAGSLSVLIGGEKKLAEEAAKFAKNDLISETVGEFPELQGIMGRYFYFYEKGVQPSEIDRYEEKYLKQNNLKNITQNSTCKIANAIRDHYKPYGISDNVPKEIISVLVALADKFDTLAGFWSVNEIPTGSKDPYALRRASLGIIRIILENQIEISLSEIFKVLSSEHSGFDLKKQQDLRQFFIERMKIYLRDQKSIRYDAVNAVLATNQDQLLQIAQRASAIHHFLETESGKTLLLAYQRASNILQQEEKKDKKIYNQKPVSSLFRDKSEEKLYKALLKTYEKVEKEIETGYYEQVLLSISETKQVVDYFFETVHVNDPKPEIRENRLNLLSQIRQLLLKVADFSMIRGLS